MTVLEAYDWMDARRTMRRRVFARDQRHVACRRADPFPDRPREVREAHGLRTTPETLPRHPGARHWRRTAGGTPCDAGADANLDRPKSCVKQRRARTVHSSNERAESAGRPVGRHVCQRIPIRVAPFPDNDFSTHRLAARRRHTILIT
ncbi:hypothetical protein LGM46_22995 [Burkholderia arboris]|uniref:hypothetical protein n=1 Tax=Burkholderia arboris TaxID=488730 RepID=UPI001CF59263|nr:hypothetical protein [Burkholderia arboris]MCA8035837.1 hypothetical protein [Burkholderia arboris]